MNPLNETLADIEALAHRVSWELMDESQRDDFMARVVVPRWGKVTADGVLLKGTAWAQMLGTTPRTIQARALRLQAADQEESVSAVRPGPNQQASIRSAKAAIRKHPELAVDLLADPAVRDAVEDAAIEQRATAPAVDIDPAEGREQVRRNMGRALGTETDQATDYLRGAATDIAHALMARERWGIDHPEAEAAALADVDRFLASYRGRADLTEADRAWLDSIGAEL